ncbi:hypothetical protein [Saccharothrix xinjiangensis]|uniref:Ricin-type beta-trefoil lectin protein n=1 Tax=Saccharothrix xinjiangensis TaxID=204798 RepID=A0ABV9XSQ9_9PSEU
MRRLLLVLAALLLLAPTAQAGPNPVIHVKRAGSPSLELSTTADGVVTLRPGAGGTDQRWRMYFVGSDRVVLVSLSASGCLTAVAPRDVRLLDPCSGEPDQVWARHALPDESFALENTGHAGQCLSARPFTRVELAACDNGRDRLWTAVIEPNP